MPAYNAGKYIADSIESVLQQSYKDWELIIVDDKSTDNTYEISLKFAHHDDRIKVYQLEKNSGSAQRPRLMAEKIAKGKLVCYLDADDILESMYLEKLLNRQIETQADAIIGRLCGLTTDGIKQNPFNPKLGFDLDSLVSGKEAFMLTVGSWEINGLGLFKKEVLDIALNKTSRLIDSINADELYTRIKFLSCNTVAFCQADYYYRNNLESITKKFSIKLFDCLDAVSSVRLLTCEIFGKNSKEYAKATSYHFSTIRYCISLFRKKISSIDVDKRLSIKNKIHSNWRQLSVIEVFRSSVKEGILYFLGFNFVYMAYILRNYVKFK